MGIGTISSDLVHVEIAARTDRGKVRENNEDAYLVFRVGRFMERMESNIPESDLPSRYDPGGYLMVVADGMGGRAAGEVASHGALIEGLRLALRAPKWLLSLDDPNTREQEIQAFFERARGYLAGMHAAVTREAASDPAKSGMGTTFTAGYSVGLDLFVIHVGDSRIYLTREGGVRRITHDHTLAQRLADVGAISQEEVSSHPQRNVLTRVIGGAGGWLRGETHHLRLALGDRIVLCTDGLTAVLDEEDIGRIVSKDEDPEIVCGKLMDLALQRGAPDNVTVIVARYGETPSRTPA